MTKNKEDDGKDKKVRSNQNTAHLRAMANPKVPELVNDLRRHWESLEFQQRGAMLLELVALGCSARGLAEELQQKESSLRRYMALAKPPKTDSAAIMTAAAAPKKTIPAPKASDVRPTLPPPPVFSQPVIENPRTTTQERPASESAPNKQENRAGEISPKRRYLAAMYGEPIQDGKSDQIRRLEEIADSPMKQQPIQNPKSLRRQGKPGV